jgi:hypothetical protein
LLNHINLKRCSQFKSSEKRLSINLNGQKQLTPMVIIEYNLIWTNRPPARKPTARREQRNICHQGTKINAKWLN